MPEFKELQTDHFPNTYALIMCGGKSSRMGTDKSMLTYYDKPQRYHMYDLLLPFCERVFIACNQAQANNIEAGHDFIQDDETFGDIGPMTALLTAFTQYPEKNILLNGCDYPFLKANELQAFSTQCKELPAAFYNQKDERYEPMLAWYPSSCFNNLKTMYEAKQFSLQLLLNQSQSAKYLPADVNSIKSVDTKDAFTRAVNRLNAG